MYVPYKVNCVQVEKRCCTYYFTLKCAIYGSSYDVIKILKFPIKLVVFHILHILVVILYLCLLQPSVIHQDFLRFVHADDHKVLLNNLKLVPSPPEQVGET